MAFNKTTTQVSTIDYRCSIDSSLQKALFYAPQSETAVPLMVALHTWSHDYTQASSSNYSEYCIEKDWAFIFPDFRGSNDNPVAAGSEKVIQDIIDALTYAKSVANIDSSRIYLVDASGGGHAALLVAAKSPEIWAGVSAWVPITDLLAWISESKVRGNTYWQDIENACSGDPTIDSSAFEEARKRSPLYFIDNARQTNIDINAGIRDGHENYSVPVSHSLLAFNRLALTEDTLASSDIAYFEQQAQVPDHLKNEAETDSLYGVKKVLFRRQSHNARITIFDGVHEILYPAACDWLSRQKLP